MQINGIGMVAFGLGGTSGNLVAGLLQQTTGGLSDLYALSLHLRAARVSGYLH